MGFQLRVVVSCDDCLTAVSIVALRTALALLGFTELVDRSDEVASFDSQPIIKDSLGKYLAMGLDVTLYDIRRHFL